MKSWKCLGIGAQLSSFSSLPILERGTKLTEHRLMEVRVLEKSFSTVKYRSEIDRVLQFNM